MSWLTRLLPYLDRADLWQTAESEYQRHNFPFAGGPGPHTGLSTLVPVFGCPADWRARDVQIIEPSQQMVACTSYLGVEGVNLWTRDGILFVDSAVRISDVVDGTSQTLFAGERPPSSDSRFGWWYAGVGQRDTGSADMLLGVEEQNTTAGILTSCPNGTYTYGPGQSTNKCDIFHFWSLHTGGANFLLADGSVRFLSYAAAPLMPALATRADDEAVEVPGAGQ
jgi:prepilin-type processing-associated H-X9-DG protein